LALLKQIDELREHTRDRRIELKLAFENRFRFDHTNREANEVTINYLASWLRKDDIEVDDIQALNRLYFPETGGTYRTCQTGVYDLNLNFFDASEYHMTENLWFEREESFFFRGFVARRVFLGFFDFGYLLESPILSA